MTGALEALGAALLRASLEGAAAVALVGLVVALLPRLPASVRCFLWWAACARFVVALPGWGVAVLPALPAEWSPAAAAASASPALKMPLPTEERGASVDSRTGRPPRWAAATPPWQLLSCVAAGAPAGRSLETAPAAGSHGGLPLRRRGSGSCSDDAARTTVFSSPRVPRNGAWPTASEPTGEPAGTRIGQASATAPRPATVAGEGRSPAAPPLGAAAPASQRTDAAPAAVWPHRSSSWGRRAASPAAIALPWLAALWLAGLAAAAVGLGRALGRLRRLLAGARPVTEGHLAATLARLCRRLRLRPPALLASPAVRSPLVVGPARPRVLLPEAGLAEMSAAEAEMVLCHELAHLRRHDLWLGWLPSLARTIFFFHPLAALAAREYALAREAACDAEVLRVLGSAPRDYGRLLLRWGLAPRESGLAAAAAAPSRHHLKRRLLMLDRHNHAPRRRALLWAAPAAVALLALLPLRLVATEGEAAMLDPSLFAALSSHPAWSGDQAPDPPEPLPRPIDTSAPAAPAAPPTETAAPHSPAERPGSLPNPAPQAPPAIGSTAASAAPHLPPARPGALPTPAPPAPPALDAPAAPSAAPWPAPAAGDGTAPAAAPPPPAAVPRPAATPAPAVPPATGPAATRPAPDAPSARPARPARPTPAVSGGVDRPASPGATASAPVAWGAPAAFAATPAPAAGSRSTSTYSFGNSDRGAWVYVEGGSRTMSGSSGDAERALAARRGEEPLLYVRRGGDAWVVRDAALLAEAKRILEPVLALGRQQGELGGRQGELGGEQGALGSRQGQLGGEQGKLGAEQGRLSAELSRLGAELAEVEARRRRASEGERPGLDARRGEIRARMDGLEQRIEALGRQQRELGARQRALGDEQRALGERQRELGDRQRELGNRQREASAAAERQLEGLIDRARAAGKAEAVR